MSVEDQSTGLADHFTGVIAVSLTISWPFILFIVFELIYKLSIQTF